MEHATLMHQQHVIRTRFNIMVTMTLGYIFNLRSFSSILIVEVVKVINVLKLKKISNLIAIVVHVEKFNGLLKVLRHILALNVYH